MKNKNLKRIIAKLALLFSAIALLANMVSVGTVTAATFSNDWTWSPAPGDPAFSDDALIDIARTFDGNYMITYSEFDGAIYSIKLDKYTPTGTRIWTITVRTLAAGETVIPQFSTIKPDGGGGVYASYTIDDGTGIYSSWAYQFDTDGVLWASGAKNLGSAMGLTDAWNTRIWVDSTGNAVFAVFGDDGSGAVDAYMSSYNVVGSTIFGVTPLGLSTTKLGSQSIQLLDYSADTTHFYVVAGFIDNTDTRGTVRTWRYDLGGSEDLTFDSVSSTIKTIDPVDTLVHFDSVRTDSGLGIATTISDSTGNDNIDFRHIDNTGTIDITYPVDAYPSLSDNASYIEYDGTQGLLGSVYVINNHSALGQTDIRFTSIDIDSGGTISDTWTEGDSVLDERLTVDIRGENTYTIDGDSISSTLYQEDGGGTNYWGLVSVDPGFTDSALDISSTVKGLTALLEINDTANGVIWIFDSTLDLISGGSYIIIPSGGCTPGPNQQCATLTLTGAKDIFYEGYGAPMTGVVFNSLTTESFDQSTVANFTGSSPWPDTAFIGVIDLEGASTTWNLAIQGPPTLDDGAKSINLLPGGPGSDRMFAETTGHNFTTGFDLTDNGGTNYPMTFNDGVFDSYDIWYWLSSGYTWLEADVTGPLNVPVGTDLTDATNYNSGIINSPVALLNKGTNPVLGIFGTGISFALTVPGGTPAGSYSGDITYTLS